MQPVIPVLERFQMRRSSLGCFLGYTAVGLAPAPVHLGASSPVSPASGRQALVPYLVTDAMSLCLSWVSAPEVDCPGGVAEGHPLLSPEPQTGVCAALGTL